MKKKVGLAIVTYGTNYGTYLQAFATQCIVRKLGYDTEIINIDSVKSEVLSARKKYFAKQIFYLPELKSYKNVIKGLVLEKTNSEYKAYIGDRKKQFAKFNDSYFEFSERRDSWSGLTELCKERYDHVLVGSDQLWRPANIAGGFYTLDFVPDNVNKIAYATSFGLKEIRVNQEKKAKEFLSRIQHLSVREHSGAEIVKQLTQRNIPVVCDPTLLLDEEDWCKYIPEQPIISGKYIFCYFLGDNKQHREYVRNLSDKTGCKIVSLPHIAGYISIDKKFADIAPKGIGPFEFLNLIKNAEFVCTDSFHGCVFSSLFNKKLFVFRRFAQENTMSTNDRIITLLSALNMENSLVYGTEDISEALENITDYILVKSHIISIRKKSLEYLCNSLNRVKTDLSDI